jgi:hypothetical protein
MAVIVYRMYKIPNARNIKEGLEVIRKLMEPVKDEEYFIKDWGKVEEDKPRGWGSILKRQLKGE